MIFLAVILVLIAAFYFYLSRNYGYWEKQGLKCDKPELIFGNNRAMFTGTRSRAQIASDYYWRYPNEKVVGFYRGSTPELIIRDPDLVKQIMIHDFNYFYARGLAPSMYHLEPIQRNVLNLDGDEWKLLRQRLTPAFSSGKLKAMFPLIVERAESLQKKAIFLASQGKPIMARDLMQRFTIDFIGACGFGLEANAINDENSEFHKLGYLIMENDWKHKLLVILKYTFPNLTRSIKLFGEVEKIVVDLVNQIMKERKYEPSGRNDFIDLLLEVRKKGIMTGTPMDKSKSDGTKLATLELDDMLIAAQVFIFFVAGFETSSTVSSFTLHQLAYNPEIQRKVQAEIDTVLSKHNNKLSYEAVHDMTYLDLTLKEGMRIIPAAGVISRSCTKEYHIKDLGITIQPGHRIAIPVQALHMDPKYFENPEEFRPERFSSEEFNKNQGVYLPFGDGPRACIGLRLGTMQSLAGLAAVLSMFTVSPAPESEKEPKIDPSSHIVQGVVGGLPLTFTRRK